MGIHKDVLKGSLRKWCVWCLGLSILFAILTLAVIPHVAEAIRAESTSIYEVYPNVSPIPFFGFQISVCLWYFCWLQHLLFLAGVLIYTFAASKEEAADQSPR